MLRRGTREYGVVMKTSITRLVNTRSRTEDWSGYNDIHVYLYTYNVYIFMWVHNIVYLLYIYIYSYRKIQNIIYSRAGEHMAPCRTRTIRRRRVRQAFMYYAMGEQSTRSDPLFLHHIILFIHLTKTILQNNKNYKYISIFSLNLFHSKR